MKDMKIADLLFLCLSGRRVITCCKPCSEHLKIEHISRVCVTSECPLPLYLCVLVCVYVCGEGGFVGGGEGCVCVFCGGGGGGLSVCGGGGGLCVRGGVFWGEGGVDGPFVFL